MYDPSQPSQGHTPVIESTFLGQVITQRRWHHRRIVSVTQPLVVTSRHPGSVHASSPTRARTRRKSFPPLCKRRSPLSLFSSFLSLSLFSSFPYPSHIFFLTPFLTLDSLLHLPPNQNLSGDPSSARRSREDLNFVDKQTPETKTHTWRTDERLCPLI